MGLRMEVNGRCLDCSCHVFHPAGASSEPDHETIARIHIAIEKADRMQRLAAELLVTSRSAATWQDEDRGGRRAAGASPVKAAASGIHGQ